MTLQIDSDGATFRLVKKSSDDSVTLVARDDETGEIIGEIKFMSLQEARDCAESILSCSDAAREFAGWNVSLHG
tara:strand:- start:31180 stop:31401 length:222 start_codon:yes stop_codon:yes gene_type:complete